jgi:DedD protein
MDEAAKRRLVGAAVLVALAVIFIPMLIEQDSEDLGDPIVIPEPPEMESDGFADEGGVGFDAPLPTAEDLALPLPTPEPPGSEPSPVQGDGASSGEAASGSTGTSIGATGGATGESTAPAPSRANEAVALAPAGPKPVPAGVSAWVIQVSSLGSPEAARSLQDELRAKGYPAFVEQAEVRGRRYYRVRVGPEVERARADRIAQQLAGETGAQPLVQRYP